MGTVPMGTGALRTIHSRVSWMFFPVERSITVSAPHLMDHLIFSTSSSIEDSTAELPMLALIFTRKLRPMIIGSLSGCLMLAGVMGRRGAAARDFVTDEFGGDVFRDGSAEGLAGVLVVEG